MYCMEKGVQCQYANGFGCCNMTACIRYDINGQTIIISKTLPADKEGEGHDTSH